MKEGFRVTIPDDQHVLSKPLFVSAGYGRIGFLPQGTSLRYIESFPEGFARYVVFINVEGAQLEFKGVLGSHYVRPIVTHSSFLKSGSELPFSIQDLRQMLDSVGVEKSHVKELLDTYE